MLVYTAVPASVYEPFRTATVTNKRMLFYLYETKTMETLNHNSNNTDLNSSRNSYCIDQATF